MCGRCIYRWLCKYRNNWNRIRACLHLPEPRNKLLWQFLRTVLKCTTHYCGTAIWSTLYYPKQHWVFECVHCAVSLRLTKFWKPDPFPRWITDPFIQTSYKRPPHFITWELRQVQLLIHALFNATYSLLSGALAIQCQTVQWSVNDKLERTRKLLCFLSRHYLSIHLENVKKITKHPSPGSWRPIWE